MTKVYRTTDLTKWGTGKGSNLLPTEVDNNFWDSESRLESLEARVTDFSSIDYFSVDGTQFFVHLTDHTILGPYDLPLAQWNWRNQWQPNTAYALNDVFQFNGSLYLDIFAPNPGQTSFDPNASDGLGNKFYALILETPSDVLPPHGDTGQVLVKASGADFDVAWGSILPATEDAIGGVFATPEVASNWVSGIDPHGNLVLTQPAFTDISGIVQEGQLIEQKIQTVTSESGGLTIDYSLGAICLLTMSENITALDVENWPVDDLGKLTLFITNSGSFTISDWAGALWPGSTPPVVGTKDIISLVNNQISIYGAIVGQAYG